MSLRSGFASITGSVKRAARRILGASEESEEDNNDGNPSSDDEKESEGSTQGSQDESVSDQEDDDVLLPLTTDGPGDGTSTAEVIASVHDGSYLHLPKSDGVEESDLPAITPFVVSPPAEVKTPAARRRPSELKYDVSKAVATKVSSKLDFSDDTLRKLAKVLKSSTPTPITTPVTKYILPRSRLPKLNYTKQILVNQSNFAAWIEQIKVYTYSRRWPEWCTSVGGSVTWDGVDDDSDESVARREAYEWMENSIPEGTKYILIFIKKGDAKAVYEALWKRFAALTVKELQQKFWLLDMKENQQVDQFAHVVYTAAVNLQHAGQPVSDQQLATAYIQGLNKNYVFIKEKYRTMNIYSFVSAVEDATNFAIANKLMNVQSSSSSGGTKSSSSVLIADGTMCKYWRMKRGCFKEDKCPLAEYHTPETAGKGWNQDKAKTGAKNEERKCYSCNKVGHLRQNCPLKNDQSKDKAKANQRNNANEINNLSLNFMMISPVSASLFASFDLKSQWILDSGATEHICSSAKLVTQGTLATLSVPTQLTVGNGQVLQASQSGTVHFNDVSLSGVLVCEQCPVNIISEGKLIEKGLTITKSAQQGCQIMQGENVIMTARIQNKLMFVDKAVLSSDLIDVRRIK
jgi:hypothetical protein